MPESAAALVAILGTRPLDCRPRACSLLASFSWPLPLGYRLTWMPTSLNQAIDRRSREPPPYARLLDAFHRAYAAELAEIVGTLPVRPGDRVLDLACGDGVYARLFSDLVAPGGFVCGIDLSAASLDCACSKPSERDSSPAYCRASATALPLATGSFDVVWCAQSFYSLPDPARAVQEMVRVARAGGIVAVLENDTLHQLLLPWPVDLELEVRVAELQAFAHETARPGKYYVGRQLSAALMSAGLNHVAEKAWATTRQAPLADADRAFVEEYLDALRRHVSPLLEADTLQRLDRWLGRHNRQPALERPGFSTVWIDRLCWGIKPGIVRRKKSRAPRLLKGAGHRERSD